MMATIIIFQDERPVFLREQANKMYYVTPYYMSKVVMDLPFVIVTPLLSTIILYFGVGFERTAGQFFYFYLVLFLVVMNASSFGYLCSSIFSKAETATGLAPIIIMPILLFSGFFSNSGSYPVWIGWIQWISPIRYGLEGLVYNEFSTRHYGPYDINMIDFLSFKLGLSKCLIILAVISIFVRFLSLFFLKTLISKFQ